MTKEIKQTHKHDYSNIWWCPYYDTKREIMIPTCWKCGKIKYKNIKYIGRRKNGSRIIKEIKI